MGQTSVFPCHRMIEMHHLPSCHSHAIPPSCESTLFMHQKMLREMEMRSSKMGGMPLSADVSVHTKFSYVVCADPWVYHQGYDPWGVWVGARPWTPRGLPLSFSIITECILLWSGALVPYAFNSSVHHVLGLATLFNMTRQPPWPIFKIKTMMTICILMILLAILLGFAQGATLGHQVVWAC